jgi:hypothetical protein
MLELQQGRSGHNRARLARQVQLPHSLVSGVLDATDARCRMLRGAAQVSDDATCKP